MRHVNYRYVMLLAICIVAAAWSAQAQVSLTVGSAQTNCGNTMQIPITVSGAEDIDAFGMTLNYDPAILSLLSVRSGAATSNWAAASGNERSLGHVVIGGFKGTGTPITGTGILTILTFECDVCPSTTNLNLTSIVDDLAGSIVFSGTATCTGGDSPPPASSTSESTASPKRVVSSRRNLSSPPSLFASPLNFSITVDEGEDAPSQTFTVSNSGGGTLDYTVRDAISWISETPNAGSISNDTDTITIRYATASLAPGSYTGTINIDSDDTTDSLQSIFLSLTVVPRPSISVSPSMLSIAINEGEIAQSGSFTVRNSGGGTLNHSIGDDATWITVNPASGSSSGELNDVTVSYDTASLVPGTYTGQITVSDPRAKNGPQSVSVTLTVTAVRIEEESSADTSADSSEGGDSGDGGGGCFIATAAYGTPLDGRIDVLREVRDTYLLENGLGAAFVDAYYRMSPPLAEQVARHPALRASIRTILNPIIWASEVALGLPELILAAFGLMVSATLFVGIRIKYSR